MYYPCDQDFDHIIGEALWQVSQWFTWRRKYLEKNNKYDADLQSRLSKKRYSNLKIRGKRQSKKSIPHLKISIENINSYRWDMLHGYD